jgi:PAS domain S-box-containing protein
MASRFLGNRENGTQEKGRDLYLGLLPVLLLIVLLVGFRMFLRSSVIYEPALLLPVLNTIFLFLVSCVVSYVAMRSYLLSGSPTILLLGCGVLTLGTGALAAGWLIGPEGPNVNVTIFNVSALLSSAFHSLGAVVDYRQRPPEADPERRRLKLLAGYLGVPIFVALLALAASEGIIPPFFVQGVGPTTPRQAVLAIGLVLFGCTALYTMSRFITEKREFFYWYSLALILLAMTLIGALLQPAVGSLLGWVARCCQYLAGVYFLLSVRSALHGARTLGLSVDGAIAEVFRQSERKISSILASIPDGHYELDREWRFVRINDRALAYFGRDRELIGQSFWDVFPATRGSAFEEQYRKAVSESTSTHFEEKSVVFTDTWVEFHAYPTEERGLSVFFRDITEEKRAKIALQESEQRWATTLASIGDAVIATDTDGKITFMNTVAEKVTGWTLAEAAVKPVSVVFKIVNEQTRKEVEDPVAKVLREGMVVGLANHTLLVRKDGTEVPIDDSGAPIRDKDGNTTGVVLIFRDITERKQAEDDTRRLLTAVQNEKDRLSALVNSIQDEVWFADTGRRFTLANPSALREFGLDTYNEIDIQKLAESLEVYRIDGTPRPVDEAPPLQALQGEMVRNQEEMIRTPGTGELRYREVSASPVRDAGGTIIGSVSVVRDITDRKRTEEELIRTKSLAENRAIELQAMMEAIPALVFITHDPESSYMTGNRATHDLFGVPLEGNVSKSAPQQEQPATFRAMRDGQEIPADQLPVQQAAQGHEVRDYELDLVFTEGTTRTIFGNATPLKGLDGGTNGAVGVFIDITERKRAEEALRDSERRERERAEELATMMEAVPTPVIIVHDPDATHMTGNRAADELLRQSHGAEASLSAPSEVRPQHFRAVKDGRELMLDELPAQRAARGEHVQDFEFSLVFDDGTTRHLLAYGTPLWDNMRQPRGAVHTLVDITDRKRAEEALRESEEHYRTLFEMMNEGFALDEIICDESGKPYDLRYLTVNPAFESQTGCKAKDIIGRTTLELFPEAEPITFERYGKVALTGEPEHFEEWFAPLGRWFEVSAFRTGPNRFGTVFTDITERKQTEEALKESEARLRVAKNAAHLGIHDWDVTSGNVGWDERVREIWGVGPDEPITYDVFKAGLHPDDLAPTQEAVDRAHDPAGSGEFYAEYRVINRIDKVTRWVAATGHVFFQEGRAVRLIGTVEDITERKWMEEELRKSRDELELRVQERTEAIRRQADLLELAHNAILVRDLENRITFWNHGAEELYGWTRHEALGNVTHVFLKTRFPVPFDEYMALLTKEGRWEGELEHTTKDGRTITVLSRQTLQRDEAGNPAAMLEINLDVTEAKRTEQQFRQAQKMEALGTITGGVAHDFNNILAAIIGFTELVAGHAAKGSRDERHLARIMESSLRGRDLVKQMLTYARKTEQEKKPLSLSTIVKETVKLIRATTPTTISIKVDTGSESGPILADPTQIQQIIMNLCTNAAHAMRERGGTLDIQVNNHTVSPSNGNPHGVNPGLYTRLIVRDTGTGMSPDIMDKIFDPFFTTKKVGEGTGLGLSVVHGIVKQSNGYITVESEPGKGSTFTVYFPKIAGQIEADAVSDDELPTGSERILFVDDEEALVEMAEDILAELGYEVTSRMSSRESLTLFKEDPSRFDLIITDQTMPEMTGVELVKEILALRADMPIIMCTGFSYMVNENSAKAAGIRAFAMKPLTKREIARTIRKVLDK